MMGVSGGGLSSPDKTPSSSNARFFIQVNDVDNSNSNNEDLLDPRRRVENINPPPLTNTPKINLNLAPHSSSSSQISSSSSKHLPPLKSPSIPSIVEPLEQPVDLNTEHLAMQFERKEKLRQKVQRSSDELARLKRDINELRKRLEPHIQLIKISTDNVRLQHQCNILAEEVDKYTDGTIPLGETNEAFYRDLSPRPEPPSLPAPILQGRLPTGSMRKIPPPRPPPPNSLRIPWDCTKCTFRNHPDLSSCEQCEMIRILSSNSPHPSTSSSSSILQGSLEPS